MQAILSLDSRLLATVIDLTYYRSESGKLLPLVECRRHIPACFGLKAAEKYRGAAVSTAASVVSPVTTPLSSFHFLLQRDITSCLFFFFYSLHLPLHLFFLICTDKGGRALHQISYAFTSFFHALRVQWELGEAKIGQWVDVSRGIGIASSEMWGSAKDETQWKQDLDLSISPSSNVSVKAEWGECYFDEQ